MANIINYCGKCEEKTLLQIRRNKVRLPFTAFAGRSIRGESLIIVPTIHLVPLPMIITIKMIIMKIIIMIMIIMKRTILIIVPVLHCKSLRSPFELFWTGKYSYLPA